MVHNYLGILCLNEDETEISSLSHHRTLASIPIGGRYRIIDFILSNLVNSGIKNVGVLTPYNSRSLLDHIGTGKSWDLDRKLGGIFMTLSGHKNNFSDVEVLSKNLEHLERSKEEFVLLSPSYMVCNINFANAAKDFTTSGADVGILYKAIDNAKTSFKGCYTLNFDENKNVSSVGKNVGFDDNLNICTEMFLMKKTLLIKILYDCIKKGSFTNLKDYIFSEIKNLKVASYEITGYLQCVNSIYSYYKFNMDLLNPTISKDLFESNGVIYTKITDSPPTRYSDNSKIRNSLVANGCLIDGDIENCVIGKNVIIEKGAILKNCIIMKNSRVGANSNLVNTIVDKNGKIDEFQQLKGAEEFPLIVQKKVNF